MAGDERFAAIPDILAFTPVPRRAHANGWTPEHQRAFIAALAITGSARQAARAIGRAAFGAEQLRTSKGGRSFAAAWDAALDIHRDRETAHLHDNLSGLAERREAELAQAKAGGRFILAEPFGGEDADEAREVEEARARCRGRLVNARRLYMAEIAHDPAKRAAWEVLIERSVDWEKAALIQPQENEPYAPGLREPGMILACEAQWLAELTGGPDKTRVLGQALAARIAEGEAEGR